MTTDRQQEREALPESVVRDCLTEFFTRGANVTADQCGKLVSTIIETMYDCAALHRRPSAAPAIQIQACRPEDRAMANTPAGQAMLNAAAKALASEPAPTASDWDRFDPALGVPAAPQPPAAPPSPARDKAEVSTVGDSPSAGSVPNNDEVICPNCTHQFRAIPVNVQKLLIAAGVEPPFKGRAVVVAPNKERGNG